MRNKILNYYFAETKVQENLRKQTKLEETLT